MALLLAKEKEQVIFLLWTTAQSISYSVKRLSTVAGLIRFLNQFSYLDLGSSIEDFPLTSQDMVSYTFRQLHILMFKIIFLETKRFVCEMN